MNLRLWCIKKLGGFVSVEAALDSIKDSDEESKDRVLTEAVKRLFNTTSADDVLRVENGGSVMYFEGRPLTQIEITNLKEQAVALLGTKLWRVLKREIQYQINVKMFHDPNTRSEVRWGKLVYFYDEIIRKVLQRLK